MSDHLRSDADAWAIVEDNLALVRSVVGRHRAAAQPADFDDHVSAGTIGAFRAARRWDAREGTFATYAYPRILGAILDAEREPNFRRMKRMGRDYDKPLRLDADLLNADGLALIETLTIDDDPSLTLTAIAELCTDDRERDLFASHLLGRETLAKFGARHDITGSRASQLRKALRERVAELVDA